MFYSLQCWMHCNAISSFLYIASVWFTGASPSTSPRHFPLTLLMSSWDSLFLPFDTTCILYWTNQKLVIYSWIILYVLTATQAPLFHLSLVTLCNTFFPPVFFMHLVMRMVFPPSCLQVEYSSSSSICRFQENVSEFSLNLHRRCFLKHHTNHSFLSPRTPYFPLVTS